MKTRIKMGCLPGDAGKIMKIQMMENRVGPMTRNASFLRCAKGFRLMVRMKEKALIKERVRKEIEASLETE